jgi:predicted Fe-S protein YdhL (DUF1289 family)
MTLMPQFPDLQQPDEVASPCTGVCKLNEKRICVGCFRSIDEIMAWPTAGAALRTTILERCSKRKENHNG